jgi:phosphoribosylanthranilate isomerase
MMVKICGITRAEDAEIAIGLGAAAIGFVFWPGSPRFIDPYRARRIARVVSPFVTTVGVFVNQPEPYVNAVANVVPLGAVQLHGEETPAFAHEMRRPVVKAVTRFDTEVVSEWPAAVMLLVDAHDPVRRGGTGAKADWSGAAAVARVRRVLLAGGLTAENVGEAIALVRPFGIDVSSGVEASPGVKDPRKLAALFAAVSRSQTS